MERKDHALPRVGHRGLEQGAGPIDPHGQTVLAAEETLQAFEDGIAIDELGVGRVGAQFPNPDVAVANRVPMVLQRERQLVLVTPVGFALQPARGTDQFDVVLHQHPVVQHGQTGGRHDGSFATESWAGEEDIVGLPFPWRPGGVDQGRVLSVGRGRLPVGVGDASVGIQHLDLVEAHQEHPAVSPALARALRRRGCRPLDMELTVPERLQGADVPAALDAFQRTLPDDPSGSRSVQTHPGIQSRPVEEDGGIGRRAAGAFRSAGRAGVDHGRAGPRPVVLRPIEDRGFSGGGGESEAEQGGPGGQATSVGAGLGSFHDIGGMSLGTMADPGRRRKPELWALSRRAEPCFDAGMRKAARWLGRLFLVTGVAAGVLAAAVIRRVDRTPFEGKPYALATSARLEGIATPAAVEVGDRFFLAGFGRAKLTPGLGAALDDPARGAFTALPLAGYGARKGLPALGVHDDVWVKAVAFVSGTTTGVVVGADALIVPREVSDLAFQALRERRGLEPSQVYLGATHTHCSLGGWGEGWVAEAFAGGFRRGVREWMASRMVRAAEAALDDLGPALLGHGGFEAPEFVRNRLVGDAGRKDGGFSLLVFQKPGTPGRTGVLGSFSAHATVVSAGFMQFSAEYPGAWQRAVEAAGVDHAQFLAGGVGSHGPRAPSSGVEGAEAMGRELANRTLSALRSVSPEPAPWCRTLSLEVDLPPLQPRLSENVAVRPWLARRLLPVGTRTRVQAWRLGRSLWISTPCDYSGELALDLKALARTRGLDAVVTSFNGDYLGYVVPAEYYGMSGYETRTMAFYGPQLPGYLSGLLRQLVVRSAEASPPADPGPAPGSEARSVRPGGAFVKVTGRR